MTSDEIRGLARQAFDAMERCEREDGSQYVRVRDDAPAWVGTLVHAAHGDLLPDDWRYETIRDALAAIADSTLGEDYDEAHAFADDADIYNSDLLAWVGSNLTRGSYVDEAREEYGEPRDFYHSIQMGQYMERREVFDAVLAALTERADLEVAFDVPSDYGDESRVEAADAR